METSSEELSTEPEPVSESARKSARSPRLGFTLLYCAEAPQRAGAFIAVPDSQTAKPFILGRGSSRASDGALRLSAVFQRPGENFRLPPFENPALSRVQLEVSHAPGGFRLRNVGRCPLVINGEPTADGVARPGDLIEIGRQLVLVCSARLEAIDDDGWRATHRHGEPDEDGIVGESPAAWKLRHEIRFVAAREGHVLIHGASGTGKELVAAAIHRLSRSGKPWVARNAATFPQSLIDAELFGNAKAYPNPGMPERKGLVGAADQGSLFLDEFAELPMDAQTHLLRVLDGGEFQRLGDTTTRHSDFRLIAATNRPLTDVRVDVLARFAFRISVPNLSVRPEDIALLARHWLRVMARDDASLAKRFLNAQLEPQLSSEFLVYLVTLPLPTNARHLRNLLWDAIRTSEDGMLRAPPSTGAEPARVNRPEPDAEPSAARLEAVLAANEGSIERTWRALGLPNRFALMRLMKKNAVQIRRQPKRI
jgi:two-component system nitrogen regulation response regulator GlnG/two-component system response regulator HydG